MRMCLGRSAIGARARAHTGSHQTTTRTLETEIADRLLLFAPRRELQLEFQQEMHPSTSPDMLNNGEPVQARLFPPPRAAAALCGGSDGRAVAQWRRDGSCPTLVALGETGKNQMSTHAVSVTLYLTPGFCARKHASMSRSSTSSGNCMLYLFSHSISKTNRWVVTLNIK